MKYSQGMSVPQFREILKDKNITLVDAILSDDVYLFHYGFKDFQSEKYFGILGTYYVCAYLAIEYGTIIIGERTITIIVGGNCWCFY